MNGRELLWLHCNLDGHEVVQNLYVAQTLAHEVTVSPHGVTALAASMGPQGLTKIFVDEASRT